MDARPSVLMQLGVRALLVFGGRRVRVLLFLLLGGLVLALGARRSCFQRQFAAAVRRALSDEDRPQHRAELGRAGSPTRPWTPADRDRESARRARAAWAAQPVTLASVSTWRQWLVEWGWARHLRAEVEVLDVDGRFRRLAVMFGMDPDRPGERWWVVLGYVDLPKHGAQPISGAPFSGLVW